MFVDAALIPDPLSWWLAALAAAVLLPCLRYAEWRAMMQVPLRQHLLFASLLFLVILWLISVRMFDGLWLHFMGVTTVTLLVGPNRLIPTGSFILLTVLPPVRPSP